MKIYIIHYRKSYDVHTDQGLKHFCESGKVDIEAKNKEEAKDAFFEMFDKRADVLLCQYNVKIEIENITKKQKQKNVTGLTEQTKQKILKDFLKKC